MDYRLETIKTMLMMLLVRNGTDRTGIKRLNKMWEDSKELDKCLKGGIKGKE